VGPLRRSANCLVLLWKPNTSYTAMRARWALGSPSQRIKKREGEQEKRRGKERDVVETQTRVCGLTGL
jgi:hypothetical protein